MPVFSFGPNGPNWDAVDFLAKGQGLSTQEYVNQYPHGMLQNIIGGVGRTNLKGLVRVTVKCIRIRTIFPCGTTTFSITGNAYCSSGECNITTNDFHARPSIFRSCIAGTEFDNESYSGDYGYGIFDKQCGSEL
jgi:hypothetical protein